MNLALGYGHYTHIESGMHGVAWLSGVVDPVSFKQTFHVLNQHTVLPRGQLGPSAQHKHLEMKLFSENNKYA